MKFEPNYPMERLDDIFYSTEDSAIMDELWNPLDNIETDSEQNRIWSMKIFTLMPKMHPLKKN